MSVCVHACAHGTHLELAHLHDDVDTTIACAKGTETVEFLLHNLPRGRRDEAVRAFHRLHGVAVEQVVVPLPPAHHVRGRAHAQIELAMTKAAVKLQCPDFWVVLLPPPVPVPRPPGNG